MPPRKPPRPPEVGVEYSDEPPKSEFDPIPSQDRIPEGFDRSPGGAAYQVGFCPSLCGLHQGHGHEEPRLKPEDPPHHGFSFCVSWTFVDSTAGAERATPA